MLSSSRQSNPPFQVVVVDTKPLFSNSRWIDAGLSSIVCLKPACFLCPMLMVEGQGSYEQSSRKILSIKQIRSLSYNEVRYSDSFVFFDAFCKFQHLRQAGLVLFVLGVSTRRTGVGRGLLQGGRYST